MRIYPFAISLVILFISRLVINSGYIWLVFVFWWALAWAIGKFTHFQELRFGKISELQAELLTLQKEKEQSLKNEQILKATQSLAHDMRKPFALFHQAWEILKSAQGNEVAKILRESTAEIEQSIAQAELWLNELLEFGNTSTPIPTLVKSEELILEAFKKLAKIYPSLEFKLTFSAQLEHFLYIDQSKINRVLINVFTNAIQSLKAGGEVWVKTGMSGTHHPFAEIVIGNSGSFIPEEELKRLFDFGVTKNKEGGLGLGLWIVEKVVREHGGIIYAQSRKTELYPMGYVEFILVLPVSKETYLLDPSLIESWRSRDSVAKSTTPDAPYLPESNSKAFMGDLENQLSKQLNQRLDRILVVISDPHVAYRQQLVNLCLHSPVLKDHVTVELLDPEQDLNSQQISKQTALVIIEHNQESKWGDGFQLATLIKKINAENFVCIHSTETSLVHQKKSFSAGADVFLPKPFAVVHFYQLLLQALRAHLTHKIEFVCLDDNLIFRRSWKKHLNQCTIHEFESPSSFWRAFEDGTVDLENISFVICDFHFDNEKETDGILFSKKLFKIKKIPIFLATNDVTLDVTKIPEICARIAKEPISLKVLDNLIQIGKSRDGDLK